MATTPAMKRHGEILGVLSRIANAVDKRPLSGRYEFYCNTCGVLVSLTTEHDKRLRETGRNFYCLNGHSMSYPKNEAKS